MKFSLFKKAAVETADAAIPGPAHPIAQAPAKADVKKSGLTAKQIAEGNKEALALVRVLEHLGKDYAEKNPDDLRYKDCDPEKLTDPDTFAARKNVLSKHDMAAIYRWAPKGTWRNYAQLHSLLKKEIGDFQASGYTGGLVAVEDINRPGISLMATLASDQKEWALISSLLNSIKDTYKANKLKLESAGYGTDKDYWKFNGREDKISPKGSQPTSDDAEAVRWLLQDSAKYTGDADILTNLTSEFSKMNETIAKK